MAYDYTRQVDSAKRMIAKYGQVLTITRSTVTYDPLTGMNTTATQTGTITAVADNFSTYDQKNRSELLVAKKSKKLLVSAASCTFAPKSGDKVTYEGETWTIAPMDELNPGGTPILYTLAIFQ